MTSFAWVAPVLYAASLFDVQVIPLNDANARPFLAAASAQAGSLYVLDGNTVTQYPADAPAQSVVLAPGTSAFDIDDIDRDGRPEVVAVCGERIMRYQFAQSEPEPAHELFTLRTQFMDSSSAPYPYVMIVQNDDQHLLALACEESFEVRALDGTQVASYPIGENAPRRVSYGRPFRASSIFPARTASPDAIEAQIDRSIHFEPELPGELLAVEADVPMARPATSLQLRQAGTLDPAHWPWFHLAVDGSRTQRVLYALAPPLYADTLVCIREADPSQRLKDSDKTVSPPKRYPGAAVVLDDDSRPDFNGDGYTDLLLWKGAEPLLTIDSLANTVTTGTWPLTLSVHLFSIKKNRYEPAPASRITASAPISWFVAADTTGPIRHCVLRDFNGDGRTDFGCSLSPCAFSVWLYGTSGFGRAADFEYRTDAPILEIAFQSDLEAKGQTTVGLRTRSGLQVLRPTQEHK